MQLTELSLTAEAWTTIGTGIAVLVAIAASNRSIRSEIRELRAQVYRLEERIDEFETKLTERINEFETKLTERINRFEVEIRERLARVEGTLGVIRDSMFHRHHVA